MQTPEHLSARLARLPQSVDSALATLSVSSGPEARGRAPCRLSIESIVTLFAVFSRRWAHKWEKTFVDDKARSLWRMDLENLGVGDAGLMLGLKASGGLAWPPSPAEFAALCEPDLGLPQVAFVEACHGRYPHEVIYETARRIGLWELRHWSDAQGRREFMPVYAAVCTEYRSGTRWALPEAQRVEYKPAQYEPDKALGAEAVAAMKALLAGGKAVRKREAVGYFNDEEWGRLQ